MPGKGDLSDWVELMEAVGALCPMCPVCLEKVRPVGAEVTGFAGEVRSGESESDPGFGFLITYIPYPLVALFGFMLAFKEW